MNTKKLITLAVCIALLPTLLFSASKRTYQADSAEYKTAYALCVSAGVLPPSPVSPISGDELLRAVSRIPAGALDESSRKMLEDLRNALDWTPVNQGASFSGEITPIIGPEIFLQTKAVPLYSENGCYVPSEYIIEAKDNLPTINLAMKATFGDFGYAFLENQNFSPARHVNADETFSFNFLRQIDFADWEHDATIKAGVNVGNDFLEFTIARDRQSLGYGHNGNLAIGDNFIRQDYARLHLYSDTFDYTFNLTQYDTMSDISTPGGMARVDGIDFSGYSQYYPVHRFEAKLGGKVQLVLQETSMHYISNPMDLRFLNPLLFFHGYNNYSDSAVWKGEEDNANNLMIFEFGWSVMPHLRVNAQIGFDQITFAGEIRDDEDYTRPPAYAGLLNIESAWILGGNYLNVYAEGSYATPYFYLNKKYLNENKDKYMTNLDYIVGYANWDVEDVGYTGLRYGGDSLVLSLGADYGRLGLFNVSSSLTYVRHGMYGYGYLNSVGVTGGRYVKDLAISLPKGEAEERVEFKLGGSWNAAEGLEVRGALGYISVKNMRCVKDSSFSDLQLSLGVAFDPVRMFHK